MVDLYQDYYKMLGLKTNGKYGVDDINKAYDAASRKAHPDKGGTAELFRSVAAAYEFLSSKEKSYYKFYTTIREPVYGYGEKIEKYVYYTNYRGTEFYTYRTVTDYSKWEIRSYRTKTESKTLSLTPKEYYDKERESNFEAGASKLALEGLSKGSIGTVSDLEYWMKKGVDIDFVDSNGNTMLMLAAAKNNIAVVEFLLKNGANPSLINNLGVTAIWFAYKKNNLDIVGSLLKYQANHNIADENGNTLLMFAVNKNQLGLVASLLATMEQKDAIKKAVSVALLNTVNKAGNTALWFAYKKNNQDMMKVILKAGAEPDIIDGDKILTFKVTSNTVTATVIRTGVKAQVTDTPLWHAYKTKDSVLLEDLFKNGASANSADINGNTLSIFAARNNEVNILELLYKYKADLGSKNLALKSALWFAHAKNSLQAMKFLVGKDVNINFADENGNTLLMFAAAKNDQEFVDLLLAKGAHLNTLNTLGYTALMFAYKKQHMGVMKALLKKGATPSVIDVDKNSILVFKLENDAVKTQEIHLKTKASVSDSPLFLAYKDQNTDAMKILIDSGQDINAGDINGNTISMFAANTNNIPMLKFLATIKNIDFSITNEKSGTALSFAHSKGHQEAVELIIEKGGNPNFSDGNGNTLLMFAANRNQVDFVKFLISKGADISAVNNLNKDALWFAYSKQNKEVMKIFLLDENVKPVVIDSQKNSIVVLKVDGNKIITLKEFPIKAKASASDTPLTLACKAGKIDAIDYLLKNEFARTNEADDQGNTALIYAVKSSLKAMNLLIQHEVNIDQVNNFGKSALWFAQNSNNQDAEKLLLASGAATKGAKVDSIVSSFNSNPIKFVLDYHTKIKPAVEALEHLGILHKHSDKMAVYLDKTIECLDEKSTADCKKTNCDKDYGNQLYAMCGKDGFKYSDKYSDYGDSEL